MLENTDGRGADAVLECVGTSATVNLAVDVVRKGGQVTLVGNIAPTIEVNLQSIVTRQIRLQGSCASSGEYEQCIALMAEGAIQVAALISAVAPLREGVAGNYLRNRIAFCPGSRRRCWRGRCRSSIPLQSRPD